MNGECGPISNQNFGKNNPLATQYADDVIRGFGTRDLPVGLRRGTWHQLGAKTSLSAGYNHNWTHNPASLFDHPASSAAGRLGSRTIWRSRPKLLALLHQRTDRSAAARRRRLYPVCGLCDVSVAKFGQIQNVVKSQDNFGKRSRVSDFVSVGIESQFSKTQVGGSVDTGRTVEDNCFVVDSPQQLLNCHLVTPFKAQTMVKFRDYQFPWDFARQRRGQNVSGLSYGAIRRSELDPRAVARRNLAACGTRPVCTATATVPLIPYMTMFDPRRTQVDLRLSKAFPIGGRHKLRADLDIYNVLNSSAVLYANNTYGPSWKAPVGSSVVQGFVDGRLVQLGGRVTW